MYIFGLDAHLFQLLKWTWTTEIYFDGCMIEFNCRGYEFSALTVSTNACYIFTIKENHLTAATECVTSSMSVNNIVITTTTLFTAKA